MLKIFPSTQSHFINVLARIRQEWQDATGGISLLAIDGNVGLILADLVNSLELSTEEQIQVLGAELHKEIQDLTNS
jgi:hypothetical protein